MKKNPTKPSFLKTKRSKIWNKGHLFIAPSLAGVMLFYLVPFYGVVRQSLFNSTNTGFVGIANYKLVLNNEAFILSAKIHLGL